MRPVRYLFGKKNMFIHNELHFESTALLLSGAFVTTRKLLLGGK